MANAREPAAWLREVEAHRDTGSEIAGQVIALIAKLYEIEREALNLTPQERQLMRQQRSKPITQALHAWLAAKRQTPNAEPWPRRTRSPRPSTTR